MVLVGLNAFLNSSKNRKKIEDVRKKRIQELAKAQQPNKDKLKADVKREKIRQAKETRFDERILHSQEHIVDNEFRDSKDYAFSDGSIDSKDYKIRESELDLKKYRFDDSDLDIKNYKSFDDKKEKRYYDKKVIASPKLEKVKIDFSEDILRGIIFSEILSEPKSIQNMKKGM